MISDQSRTNPQPTLRPFRDGFAASLLGECNISLTQALVQGLSWWLVPTGSEASALSNVIRAISTAHNSPSFDPHITLLSIPHTSLDESIAKVITARIASGTKPFQVQFDKIDKGDTYHQSVLAVMKYTQGDQLERLYLLLRAAVKEHMSSEPPNPPRFPHTSLFYGDGSSEAKQAIIDDIYNPSSPQATTSANSVSIGGLESYKANEVWLVRTEGAVKDWVVLAKDALKEA